MTQAANCFFEIKAPGHSPQQVTLVGSQQIIGRSLEVDITLPDQTVSRQHAEVYTDAHSRWWIKDLNSRNGTIVNGKKIPDDHLLEPDDTVQIEQFTLTFNVQGDLPGRKAQRPRTHATLNISDQPMGSVTRLDVQQAPPIDAQHLQTLIRFAEDLLATEDPNERLLKLARILISKLYHGIMAVTFDLDIAHPDEPSDMLIEPQFAHNWRREQTPYISRTLLRAVVEHQTPVIATNTDTTDNDVMALSLADDKQTLAALACPINITSKRIRVLYATFPAEFGTVGWLALASLAVEQFKQTHAAWIARLQAQEQAAMQKELQHASRIQNSLIPFSIQLDEADIAIGFEPCKYVGGDYVDIRAVDNGKIYITICDVCGKGMQAAIVTASLHALFHTAVDLNLTLVDLMTRFNRYLMRTLPNESFVTADMMIYDPATRVLESCNAGHPPAMLLKPDATARQFSIGIHAPLGFIATDYLSETVTLDQDELLCLYTDGLTESVNEADDMLRIQGVQQMLQKVYHDSQNESAETLRDKFTGLLNEYEGNAPRTDDRTFLLLKAR